MIKAGKTYFLLTLLLAASSIAMAQKHTNYWYFGKRIGLNFNVTPPQVLHNGAISTIEGCASIADNNGNLLFYTNGSVVINKNNLTMTNGNNLLGDVSSTCNTVIVPSPAGNNIYYLFTVGATNNDFEGFRYNVIDMNLQNGLGEVVTKNSLLEDDSYEKLAAVRHCNKKDVWITVRKWDSDEYHSYLVTAGGISGPVVSHTGLVINGYGNNALGALKFSADGSKLAAIHSFDNDVVELMNFDNTTGIITNPVTFKPNATIAAGGYMGIYGTEFSPDGRLLYVSSNNSNAASAILYQFDITSMDAATILSTKQILSQTVPWQGGALQAAPDQKIYLSMWRDSSLSVIENPNVYGSGCNFQYNKILVSNTVAEPLQYGLPVFIAGDMDEQYMPFDFSSVSNCNSFEVSFAMNKTTGVDSVHWDFGDGELSTAYAPVHTYSSAGDYEVNLTIYKIDCSGTSQNIIHTVSPHVAPDIHFLPADISLCSISNFSIPANISSPTYLWSTGATGDAIVVSEPGEYWAEVESGGCPVRDTFTLSLGSAIAVNIGKDTSVCATKPIILDALVNAGYLWNTGATTRTIEVTRPGNYSVKVTNAGGCTAADTLSVAWGDCDVYIPSAFTPNGDGINDEFSLSNGINAESFLMTIYNRYGQVIFTSKEPMNKWNGRFKGKPLPMGVYPWLMVYIKNGFTYTEKGTVMLIR
jgi:gliding motility-associated-like protein